MTSYTKYLTGSSKMVADGYDSMANLIYWRGYDCFEANTLPYMTRLIQTSRNFIDIGANVGVYTLLATALKPDMPVISFEPIPRVVDALQKNIAANKLSNVRVHPSAVSDHDGMTTFYLPKQQTLPTGSTSRKDLFSADQEVIVPTVKLDTIMAGEQLGTIDFMKVDTETTEPDVMRGACQILRDSEPIMICEVLLNRTTAGLHAVLDNFGYEYYWISRHGLIRRERIEGDPAVIDMNFLFITPQRKELLLSLCGVSQLEDCFRS